MIPTYSKKDQSKLDLFLMVHKHRVFRGFFMIVILFHMMLLLVPWLEVRIPSPQFVRNIFKISAGLWPFPTYQMISQENMFIRQVLMKTLELSVILLYTVDLVPKIFIWRQSLVWKVVNISILSLMMIQLPASIIAYDKVALPADKIKLRLFSISLCFVLVCEILSIREQRPLRILKFNQKQQWRQKQQKYKECRQEFNWCEIVKHDQPGDCWIVISGGVYDVTDFVDKHPGGPMIYDGAGGDCTALWYSYHPSYLTRSPPPQKYYIGRVREYVEYYSYDGSFYQAIKEEVEQTIPRQDWQNHWKLFMKAGISMIIYLVSLYYYITQTTLISAIMLGFTAAQVDVNIMHDGNHASFSSNKIFSWIAGLTMDMTFSTSVVYRRSHNFGHHSCVNHLELDRAFDTTFPLMRLHPLQPRMWYHKYQHIYVWLLYGFVNFSDVYGTFDEMSWMSNYPCRRGYISKQSQLFQIFIKFLWMYLLLFVPSMTYSFNQVFPMWFIYMMVHSYNYALFFAVNHWTTEAGVADNSNVSQTNWGMLQVQNSSNFATQSSLWTYLSGGLNYQIEHHLFPQFAHTRLVQIRDIVQRHCALYQIKYYEFNSFWHALQSHYKLLQQLGQSD